MSTSSNTPACASAHAKMAQSTAADVGRTFAHPMREGSGPRTVLQVIARSCGVVLRVDRNGEARTGDHSSECGAGTDVMRLSPA